MTNTQPIENTLRASHMFSRIGDGLVAELARGAVRKHFHRGDFIWRAGQPTLCLTIIAAGLVKICQPARDGSNAIVGLFGAHESVGDIAMIAGSEERDDAIAASEDVDLICIEKNPVLAAMQGNLAVAEALNRTLIEHSYALREKIRIMTAGTVDRRLGALLSHLATRFGDELDDGSLSIPVALSRLELACLVGATVETTIRQMSRWQKSGLVSTTDEGFIVHRPAALGVVLES